MQIKKLLFLAIAIVMMASCQKEDLVKEFFKNGSHGHLKQTKTYSSEVVIKWMNMQIRLMEATTGVANVAFSRPYAYSGIALYEAVVPGMPSCKFSCQQVKRANGFTSNRTRDCLSLANFCKCCTCNHQQTNVS